MKKDFIQILAKNPYYGRSLSFWLDFANQGNIRLYEWAMDTLRNSVRSEFTIIAVMNEIRYHLLKIDYELEKDNMRSELSIEGYYNFMDSL